MRDDCREAAAFARELILSCRRRLLKKRAGAPMEVHEKAGHSDIVTDHDLWVQRIIAGSILKRYPQHSLISEEGLRKETESPWAWVIDPIDGTANYVDSGNNYAISIGLFYENKPAYGLVMDVGGKRLYEAAFDEAPMERDDFFAPSQNILHISHKTIRFLMEAGADPLAFCDQFRGVRYLGCASLELCQIADAQTGVYISSRLKLWDFAAAACVLSRAGCILKAAPLTGGSYFVMAGRSKKLLDFC
jgi:myo-inositol-1(or 4)-monophosphatase